METVLSEIFPDCTYLVLCLECGKLIPVECYDEEDAAYAFQTNSLNLYGNQRASVVVIRLYDQKIIEWNPIICYAEAKQYVKQFINETTK